VITRSIRENEASVTDKNVLFVSTEIEMKTEDWATHSIIQCLLTSHCRQH